MADTATLKAILDLNNEWVTKYPSYEGMTAAAKKKIEAKINPLGTTMESIKEFFDVTTQKGQIVVVIVIFAVALLIFLIKRK